MSLSRRDFLKLAGVSSIAGLGGWKLLKPGEAGASIKADEVRGLKWGMLIDVSKIEGEAHYREIISACHLKHNVPDFGADKLHEIKWIWTEEYKHTFPGAEHEYMAKALEEKLFILHCNHCTDPACVRVCPTKATFKRPQDGIVAMDYHRCIGCRFCMAGCPYGARSFNWFEPASRVPKETLNLEFPRRGIGVVEKCNGCVEIVGETDYEDPEKQPYCVKASRGAMVFGNLGNPNSNIRQMLEKTYTVVRKPELGTHPNVYYVIGGGEHA